MWQQLRTEPHSAFERFTLASRGFQDGPIKAPRGYRNRRVPGQCASQTPPRSSPNATRAADVSASCSLSGTAWRGDFHYSHATWARSKISEEHRRTKSNAYPRYRETGPGSENRQGPAAMSCYFLSIRRATEPNHAPHLLDDVVKIKLLIQKNKAQKEHETL